MSCAYDGAVAYCDLDARTVELMGYHDHVASTVAVSQSGKKASSTAADYTTYIWDLDTREVANGFARSQRRC